MIFLQRSLLVDVYTRLQRILFAYMAVLYLNIKVYNNAKANPRLLRLQHKCNKRSKTSTNVLIQGEG